jgi:peptidoglycan hydrolase-like protein with peptidoglycan-binding domain
MTREAQRLLTDLGYDPGTADGKTGTQTRRAIESFQRSDDLTVDGTVGELDDAIVRASKREKSK